MTASSEQDLEHAEEEAASWLVRLSDAPEDGALLAQFEAWHAGSDLNAEAWSRVRLAYGLIGETTPLHGAHWQSYAAARNPERSLPSGEEPPAVMVPALVRMPVRRLAIAGAALAMAASLALVFLPNLGLRLQADAVTTTAEIRSIELQDGSIVRLGPESAVDIAFDTGSRRVDLIRGEAFFEVTPDPSRPFRVGAGDTTATVLGTAFEVRLEDGGTAVAVRHGRVRVDDGTTAPPTAADLLAGDWVRVRHGAGPQQGHAAPDEVAAWLDGEMVARDRPAGAIVDVLRAYYPGVIVVTSETFAARRVSGIYSLRDPEATLRDLAASHGATVRRISPWLMVVTDG